jgi:probable rRNA maturation factor
LYISVPQVLRQAPRFGTTEHEEMRRVLVHGLLHLLGYDHIKPKDRVVMRAKEEDYLGRSPYK